MKHSKRAEEWIKTAQENQENNRRVGFDRFKSGYGLQTISDWLRSIALAHKDNRYPLFTEWDQANGFAPEQAKYVTEFWDAMSTKSLRSMAGLQYAKGRKASQAELETIENSIFVIRGNKKAGEDPEKWRGYKTTAPNVTIGKLPPHGKDGVRYSGGQIYKDTYRFRLSKIRIRSRSELILEIMRIEDCDEVEAYRILNIGRQAKGFFKYHGNGLWSGSDPSVCNPTRSDVDAAKVFAKSQQLKPKTEAQEKWWELLSEMPPCYHDHEQAEIDPNNDPVIKWILRSEKTREIVRWFQARAHTKRTQKMDLAEYAHYLYDNRKHCSRDPRLKPVMRLGGKVQGRNYEGARIRKTRERNQAVHDLIKKEITELPKMKVLADIAKRPTTLPGEAANARDAVERLNSKQKARWEKLDTEFPLAPF